MTDDHPKTEPGEDEYGKVETGSEQAPNPGNDDPVENDERAHANGDD